jgi:hypothetical protein
VLSITRAGDLAAYSTGAPACSPGSWPRFHHDLANSGDIRRDAVAPGRPTDAKVLGSALIFKAPGDDLLCGAPSKYELVTSDVPIRDGDFGAAAVVTPPKPATAGESQTLDLPFALRRYVAVRAVDDAGNVGRPALVDRSPSAGGGGTAGGDNGGNNGGGGAGGGGASGGCKDRLAPRSSISRRALHASSSGLRVRGRSRDRGCAGVRRVYVSIARVRGRVCRFVTRRGKLTRGRSCRRPLLIRARGLRRWSLRLTGGLGPGRYRMVVRALDRRGNKERPRRGNSMRFRVR